MGAIYCFISWRLDFIDDYSRKVCVYFLKNKFDVFCTFKKWKALVENETGLKVKFLRSNNGVEYKDKEFIKFCSNNEIRKEKTIPRTL